MDINCSLFKTQNFQFVGNFVIATKTEEFWSVLVVVKTAAVPLKETSSLLAISCFACL